MNILLYPAFVYYFITLKWLHNITVCDHLFSKSPICRYFTVMSNSVLNILRLNGGKQPYYFLKIHS